MRTIEQITEDALSGWGPFPMTREEVVAVQMHDPYARHMSELPTYVCGRHIRLVTDMFTESIRGWADAFYGRPMAALSIGTEYWTCWHCGGKAYIDYTCTQCGAPTEQWWARLDWMIAKWKRDG